jgi:Tfp pilus assembly protein PilF/TolB-like protein
MLAAGGAFAQRSAPLPPPCSFSRGVDISARRPYVGLPTLDVLWFSYLAEGSSPGVFGDGFRQALARRVTGGVFRIGVIEDAVHRSSSAGEAGNVVTLAHRTGAKFALAGVPSIGSNGVLRVTMALFELPKRSPVWRRSFPYDSAGTLALEQAIALEVATKILGKLTEQERALLTRVPTQRGDAYDLVLRGDAYMLGGIADSAAMAYEAALKIDAKYADAQAKLALANVELYQTGNEPRGAFARLVRQGRAAADQALALDPASPYSWLADARVRMAEGKSEADWRRAFDHALTLDPRNAAVLEEYGLAVATTNDRSGARSLLQRVNSVTSGRARTATALAELALDDGHDNEACAYLNDAIASDPLYAPAWAMRGLLRARHRDLRYAWADAETSTRLGNNFLGESTAALIDLVSRDTTRARERLTDLWLTVRSQGTVNSRDGAALAAALIALGETSKGLDILESVHPRGPWYAAALRDPVFDKARMMARFRALNPPDTNPPAKTQTRSSRFAPR